RKDSDTVCLPVTVTAVDIAIKLFVEIIFPQMIVMYDHSADIGGEANDERGGKPTSKNEKRAVGMEKLSEVEMAEENGTSSVATVAMDGDGCALVVTGTAETE
ncbi:unnamed protein product, partial [Didymodactylos carnosus]